MATLKTSLSDKHSTRKIKISWFDFKEIKYTSHKSINRGRAVCVERCTYGSEGSSLIGIKFKKQRSQNHFGKLQKGSYPTQLMS